MKVGSSRPARARTCRRSSTACTGATASRSSRSAPTSPSARALSARRAPASAARAFPAAEYADRRARDVAIADWLEAAGVELVVLAGYMQLVDPAFLAALPAAA